jgi:hypothetical protein
MDFSRINPTYFVLAVITVAVLITIAVVYLRNRAAARLRLRERFGPEYERTVKEQGSERRAAAQLSEREDRVERLNIRELEPAERERFANQWNVLQLRFVDSPRGAVAEADDLIMLLMQTRGYPMSDFEQRAADISVYHPMVVENYRTAHAIAQRLREGDAGTEDLRNAMIHYRALFDEMVRVAGPTLMRRDAA